MKTVFSMGIFLGLILACNTKPTAGDYKTLEWFCGRGALTVTKTFEASRHGKVLLALDNSSLCKSSGIRMQVMAGGKAIFEETVAEFPFNRDWDIESGADMSVTTRVVDVDSSIQCIQLGDVRVTVKY